MTLCNQIFAFFLSCFFISWVYGAEPTIVINKEPSYELVVAIIENGMLKLERYSLAADLRALRDRCAGQTVFALDLSDLHQLYDCVLCNESTDGLVVIRSSNEVMNDYCLYWGAMVGVDLSEKDSHVFVSASVTRESQDGNYLRISGKIKEQPIDLDIYSQQPVTSVCAFVIPTRLVDSMRISSEVMTLSDACRLGIVMLRDRNEPLVCNEEVDREIEFERIIDAMVKDGTISIKPVSPCMAWLLTIGSNLFIKYLTVKQCIRSWWHAMCHHQQHQALVEQQSKHVSCCHA